MPDELKPCDCGAANSEGEDALVIQFATQSDNSSLKLEGTIFYVRCLKCGYIGPLVLCPNGFSKKKIFAAWNARFESEELPEWLGIILHNKLLEQTHTPVHSYSSGFYTALTWVLSLRKPEEKV